MNNAIIVRQLVTTNDRGEVSIRFERMSDMVLHEVDGKSYFSNGKYLADRNYNGDSLHRCKIEVSDAKTEMLPECGLTYDVEVTNITLKLRHERVIPR